MISIGYNETEETSIGARLTDLHLARFQLQTYFHYLHCSDF